MAHYIWFTHMPTPGQLVGVQPEPGDEPHLVHEVEGQERQRAAIRDPVELERVKLPVINAPQHLQA